ncbi:MAG: hypothetical protein QXD78_06405 [Candidatus Bathyarchaeia archaeon]
MSSPIVKKVESKGKVYYYLMEKAGGKLKKVRVLTPEEVEKYEKEGVLPYIETKESIKIPSAPKEEFVEIGKLFEAGVKQGIGPTPEGVKLKPSISKHEGEGEKSLIFDIKDEGIWVELKEKSSNATHILLVTQNRIYCGRCGSTDCEHVKFVAEYKKELK